MLRNFVQTKLSFFHFLIKLHFRNSFLLLLSKTKTIKNKFSKFQFRFLNVFLITRFLIIFASNFYFSIFFFVITKIRLLLKNSSNNKFPRISKISNKIEFSDFKFESLEICKKYFHLPTFFPVDSIKIFYLQF